MLLCRVIGVHLVSSEVTPPPVRLYACITVKLTAKVSCCAFYWQVSTGRRGGSKGGEWDEWLKENWMQKVKRTWLTVKLAARRCAPKLLYSPTPTHRSPDSNLSICLRWNKSTCYIWLFRISTEVTYQDLLRLATSRWDTWLTNCGHLLSVMLQIGSENCCIGLFES